MGRPLSEERTLKIISVKLKKNNEKYNLRRCLFINGANIVAAKSLTLVKQTM